MSIRVGVIGAGVMGADHISGRKPGGGQHPPAQLHPDRGHNRGDGSERTLGASIRTLEVADEIRRQLGIAFPGEAA